MSNKVTININNKEIFELAIDGDITDITIETTNNKHKYTINKTKNKDIRKDLEKIYNDDSFWDLKT